MPTWRSRASELQRVTVEDGSQVPGARLLAINAAERCGLRPADVDSIALMTTELAENLHRHAVGGELIVIGEHRSGTVTLVAVDRGPGVRNFNECLVDGYSTSGTLGTGLGAVVRRAESFDAVSEPGIGTVVVAALSTGDATDRPPLFDIAAIGFPLASEQVNGDDWAAVQTGSRIVITVADGLGHGPLAASASQAATELAVTTAGTEPAAMLTGMNDRLAATRGAAVTVVSTTHGDLTAGGTVAVAGLGNVAIVTVAPDTTTQRIATDHGTLGARLGTVPRERSGTIAAGSVLVLHTDGLTARWTATGRGELLRHSSTAIAARLWRDHVRTTDDALVVVVKAIPQREPE